MARQILQESRIHPAIRERVAANHRDIVEEVAAAVDAARVVIVGMAQNPFCRRARKLLDARNITYRYLEYGSYFNGWLRRNALKMWTGWPTFPMVFVAGQLIGGAEDLDGLLQSGEIERLLSATNANSTQTS